jgi:hypothetical protein
VDECEPLVHGRGLPSFPFQLNLSSSVHRVTQLNPECVLELLKLSSNVKQCQPLVHGVAADPHNDEAATVSEVGAFNPSLSPQLEPSLCPV